MLWFGLFLACDPAPSAAPAAPAASPSALVHLVPVASGFEQITDLQFPPGDSTHLAVLEKGGRASWLDLGTGARTPMFTRSVRSSSELGLLGLAFHPSWPAEPKVYVNYNPESGEMRTLIAEITLDPASGEDVSERALLEVVQPYGNHDAGQLRFGPDGMLYVGLGDGGAGGDPHGHGQDRDTLLGDMLRIDVRPGPDGAPYTVPADNPFVGQPGVRPEIWAWGLRNPWRFCFDPQGRLIVADVGQDAWEEVNIVPKGANMGWNSREGRHCFSPRQGCATEGLTEPVFEYPHEQGVSITGGVVATGKAPKAVLGSYLFADFGTGRFWSLALPDQPGVAVEARVLGDLGIHPSTFGAAADGTLYVADFASGAIFRLQ